jgi:cysteine dioxygenase
MKDFIPARVRAIIEEINHSDFIDNQKLHNLVVASGLSEKDFAAFKPFNHSLQVSYGRQLLYMDNGLKIMLMSWRSGDFTAIHDHGATKWGGVFFMGTATHRLYEFIDGELKLTQKDEINKGQFVGLEGDLIHLMGNSHNNDLITLHIYGSDANDKTPGETARVYAPELKKCFRTQGEAYLNIPKNLVFGEEPFCNIEPEAIMDYLRIVEPFYKRIKRIELIRDLEITQSYFS